MQPLGFVVFSWYAGGVKPVLSSSKRTSVPKVLPNVVILIVLFDARTFIGASERLLNSTKNT